VRRGGQDRDDDDHDDLLVGGARTAMADDLELTVQIDGSIVPFAVRDVVWGPRRR
jgi:hypothetical protein